MSEVGFDVVFSGDGGGGGGTPVTKASIGLGNVDNTSDLAKPLSTATQAALAGKADVGSVTKTSLGLGNVDNTSDLAKPISTATQAALDGKLDTGSVTKASLGLGNVDNTSDANKPVSTATQTALNAKLDTAGGTITGSLTITGGLTASRIVWPISTKTANYTIAAGDRLILANSSTAVTITLPSAVTAGAGTAYTVKNINTGVVTMGATAGTIDGAAAGTVTLAQWNSRTFISDGTNWFLV